MPFLGILAIGIKSYILEFNKNPFPIFCLNLLDQTLQNTVPGILLQLAGSYIFLSVLSRLNTSPAGLCCDPHQNILPTTHLTDSVRNTYCLAVGRNLHILKATGKW